MIGSGLTRSEHSLHGSGFEWKKNGMLPARCLTEDRNEDLILTEVVMRWGFRLLRAVIRVLGFIFGALFSIWDVITVYVFEALFLGFFGLCSGLLLPFR